MNDLISRAEAINEFKPYAAYDSNLTNAEWVSRIESVLNALPSAEPQRKKGKWNISECYGITIAECSECKRMMPTPINKYGATPLRYCPYCGSDNKGDDR